MSAEIPMLQRIVHNTKNRFAFYNFVKEKYAAAKLNDTEFAAMAQAQLGFTCNSDHVKRARKDLNIQATAVGMTRNPSGTNRHVFTRLDKIEKWIADSFGPNWDKEGE